MFRIIPLLRTFKPNNHISNSYVCQCVHNLSFGPSVFLKLTYLSSPTFSTIVPRRECIGNEYFPYTVSVRFKSVKGSKSKKESDLEDDDISEWQEKDKSLNRDSKVIVLKTTSLRNDAILKSALNIARNKVEVLFYESKIRLNGKKLTKKSYSIKPGDEIDVIKGLSIQNSEHLYVSRVEILKITAEEESISVTIRRYRSLLIDNYDDKWKPETNQLS